MQKRKEKLVYNGFLFKVYQWKQKMFDGSYETFERIERPSTVQILPMVNGKVGISLEKQPDRPEFYSLLGGRMEEGENPLSAAKRELLEETGIKARTWKLIKKNQYAGKSTYTAYLYAAGDCKKVAEPKLDSGERIRVKFVSFGGLLRMIKRIRTSSDFKMYFMEMRYEVGKRRKFEKEFGIAHR